MGGRGVHLSAPNSSKEASAVNTEDLSETLKLLVTYAMNATKGVGQSCNNKLSQANTFTDVNKSGMVMGALEPALFGKKKARFVTTMTGQKKGSQVDPDLTKAVDCSKLMSVVTREPTNSKTGRDVTMREELSKKREAAIGLSTKAGKVQGSSAAEIKKWKKEIEELKAKMMGLEKKVCEAQAKVAMAEYHASAAGTSDKKEAPHTPTSKTSTPNLSTTESGSAPNSHQEEEEATDQGPTTKGEVRNVTSTATSSFASSEVKEANDRKFFIIQ